MLANGTSMKSTLSYSHWAWFTLQFDEIDYALANTAKVETKVKLFIHLGGAWHVSVTSGIRCVDIRKFFMKQDGANKPAKPGFPHTPARMGTGQTSRYSY